jgi:serine/threonine protein kinase
MHRDIKTSNILISEDSKTIKIADFGFAGPISGLNGSGYLNKYLGTEAYMAPEILGKYPYQGQVVDLFALGIILFNLRSGRSPFNCAKRNDSHYNLIANNDADRFWKYHSD